MTPGAWWGATVGAVLGYVLAVLLPLPPLLYLPHHGTWHYSAEIVGEVTVRWYGFVFHAVVGGALGALAGGLIRRPPWWLIAWIATTAWLLLAWHEKKWFVH